MIDKIYIQKLRDLDIMKVADALGMGIRNKRALCIHHDDHHPSLAFNPRKNSCHCYSCGFSADTIGLVMERFQMIFWMPANGWLISLMFILVIQNSISLITSSLLHRKDDWIVFALFAHSEW